jgi:single stranded DNA-binding protein (ssb)
MENITVNKIEIRGRIGQEPKVTRVGKNAVARFCVATSEIFRDRSGEIKEEITWHNVSVWEEKSQTPLEELKKGDLVSVFGRIRNMKYTSAEGDDRYFVEIVANKLASVDPKSLS